MLNRKNRIRLIIAASMMLSFNAYAYEFTFYFTDDVSPCNSGGNFGKIKLYNRDDSARWFPLLSLTPGHGTKFDYGHFPYAWKAIQMISPNNNIISSKIDPGIYNITCKDGKYGIEVRTISE